MHFNRTAAQTTASEIIIKLNKELSKTFSTKTEQCNLCEGMIYCRTVVLDYYILVLARWS